MTPDPPSSEPYSAELTDEWPKDSGGRYLGSDVLAKSLRVHVVAHHTEERPPRHHPERSA